MTYYNGIYYGFYVLLVCKNFRRFLLWKIYLMNLRKESLIIKLDLGKFVVQLINSKFYFLVEEEYLMKKIFILLIALFVISPMFSESLEDLFEKVKSFDSEQNRIFYSDASFEFESEKDLFSKKDLFYGKDIIIYMTKDFSAKADIKDIVNQLLAEGLRTNYYTYFGSNYYTLEIEKSDKIVVGLKYNKSKSVYTTGYSIFKVYGLPTMEEAIALQSAEEEKKERDYNELSGKGRFTNEELEVQIANNKNAGLGAFIDAEIKHQREKNNLAGFGYKTDYEREKQKIAESLSKAEDFETNKRFCYALGCYYEGKNIEEENNISSVATEKYNKLSNLIKNGQPGYGTYNDFQLHDAWKDLLVDAEKYGTEYGRFKFTIGKLKQEKLDYSTRTATYASSINIEDSERYKKTILIVAEGYEKAYKEDWKDLPLPRNWPEEDSVSGHQSSANLVDGVAIYRSSRDWNLTDNEKYSVIGVAMLGADVSNWKKTEIYNAFAYTQAGGKNFKISNSTYGWNENILYDLKFNIIDDDGNELVKAKRYLPIKEFGTNYAKEEWKNKIEFDGISESLIEKINNGNAHVNLVSVYLEYGEYSESDDTVSAADVNSARNFVKNFPEIELSLDKIEYEYINQELEPAVDSGK